MRALPKKIVFLFIVALCFNCSSDDSTEEILPEPNPNPNKTTTYNADVKAIIDAECIRCHTDPLANGATFPMRDYAETIIGVNRDLVLRVSSTSPNNVMPPDGRLPQATIDIILDWAADGFLEE